MKKINKRQVLKLIIFFLLALYVVFVLAKQQYTLNSYSAEKKYVLSQIDKQNEYKEELISKKENVNSKEYIEEIARDKLNMFLPNERVYVNVEN